MVLYKNCFSGSYLHFFSKATSDFSATTNNPVFLCVPSRKEVKKSPTTPKLLIFFMRLLRGLEMLLSFFQNKFSPHALGMS